MKNILCFGDSNTWGYDPEGGRYPYEQRWVSLAARTLGPGFNLIPEGLNGRTTVWDDPFGDYRCGKDFLPVCLASHEPLDLVVIMLGTNDTKTFFRNTAHSIGRGMRKLVEITRASAAGPGERSPQILIISPAPVTAGDQSRAGFDLREFSELDGHRPHAVAAALPQEYARIAEDYGCAFLDAAPHAEVSGVDGVHLTAAGHNGLASAVADKILSILGG